MSWLKVIAKAGNKQIKNRMKERAKNKMIKNRREPIPEKGTCYNCKKEYPFFDTIRTKKGRLCMGCYCKDYGKE